MRHVPLLLFPFLLYNGFAFLIFTDPPVDFQKAVTGSVVLPSGTAFVLSVGTVIVLLALLLLVVELLKATRTGATMIDHAFRTLLLGACLLEFAFVRAAATGTFLTLSAVSLIDLACGVGIAPVGSDDFDDLD